MMFYLRRELLVLLLIVITPMHGIFVHAASTFTADAVCTEDHHYEEHPILCQILDRLRNDEESVVKALYGFAQSMGWIVDLKSSHAYSTTIRNLRSAPTTLTSTSAVQQQQRLPVVIAHGMGDSCFNSGLQDIGHLISSWLNNTYVTCIPTGDTQTEDTKNGYFLNMDASIDVFASKVMLDDKLRNGFHAIGFSQGNNIIRGYIARYNQPTVSTFLSINGVNAGVGAVPYCRPSSADAVSNLSRKTTTTTITANTMCDLLMEQASHAAYTEFAQSHSFQANYWRDPRPVAKERYQQYCQLAKLNNEGTVMNQTLRDNYAKTETFVWIMAQDDRMVWPAEGEHWGAPDPHNPFTIVLAMKDTEWYQQDLFGLRTAQEAGKNFFESFPGDHLQFELEDLHRWITKYITK